MKWLYTSLDWGITENVFWDMTLPELKRQIESFARQKKTRQQEQASFDYILADAIGRSVARIYSNSATMPDISELYPTLFDSQELQERKKQKQAELSALRFRQFAASYNKKFKEVAKKQ